MPTSIRKKGVLNQKLSDFETKIVEAFEKHIKLMLVDDWYITLDFTSVEDEAMQTLAKPEYRSATIEIDAEQLQDQPECIAHYVRHEIIHVLLWSYFSIAEELCYKRTEGALEKLEEQMVYLVEHMPLWPILYKGLEKETKEE